MANTTTTICKRINAAYEAWKAIENESDLRKNNLSLSDYRLLTILLEELTECKPLSKAQVDTYNSSIMKWFKKFGFVVNEFNGKFIISVL